MTFPAMGVLGYSALLHWSGKGVISDRTYRMLSPLPHLSLLVGGGWLYCTWSPSTPPTPPTPPPRRSIGTKDIENMPQLLQLIEESAHLERIDLSSWIDQLTEEVAQAIKARPDIELVRTPYALQYLATKDCGDATQALLGRMVPRRIKLSQAIAEGLDELTELLPQVRSIVVEGRSLPDSILPFLNGKRVEVGPSMESASMQKVVTEGKPAELIFPIDLSLVPLGNKYDWWGEEAIWSALRANYKVVQEMFDGSIRGVMEIQSEALSWRDIDQRCGFHNGQIKEITAPRGGKALLRRRASSH